MTTKIRQYSHLPSSSKFMFYIGCFVVNSIDYLTNTMYYIFKYFLHELCLKNYEQSSKMCGRFARNTKSQQKQLSKSRHSPAKMFKNNLHQHTYSLLILYSYCNKWWCNKIWLFASCQLPVFLKYINIQSVPIDKVHIGTYCGKWQYWDFWFLAYFLLKYY